jgi:mevalonate kinase
MHPPEGQTDPLHVVASAPAKAILLGEHAVNREQPALAVALDLRIRCTASARDDGAYSFRSEAHAESAALADVRAFRAEVDRAREAGDVVVLRELAERDFFAPARYVLGRLLDRAADFGGLDVVWRSPIPVGAGLGSGAAASAALAVAAGTLQRKELPPREVAEVAWQGDVIAHGGIASGLDSGACALGGVVRYTLSGGPEPVPAPASLRLVVADTGVVANTAAVNGRVRERLAERPWRTHLFGEIGLLAEAAVEAVADGDLERLGRLMNLNQLVLERLGVSSPELATLVEAALEAGALGAKLSGSGGGGIVVALATPGGAHDVAAAAERAGGRAFVVDAAVEGARVERASAPAAAAGAGR